MNTNNYVYKELLAYGKQCFISKDFDKAERIFATMISKFPVSLEPIYWIVEIYIYLERYEQAYKILTTSSLKQLDIRTYVDKMTIVLYRLGRDEEARSLKSLLPLSEWDLTHSIICRNPHCSDIEKYIDDLNMDDKYRGICKKYLKAEADIYQYIKDIDFTMISLGNMCFTGRYISKWSFGSLSHNEYKEFPFDLGRGSTEYILQLVHSDFKDIQDKNNILINENEFFIIGQGKYIFSHDKAKDFGWNKDKFIKQLNYRVDNFRKALHDEYIMFLMLVDELNYRHIEYANIFLNKFDGKHKLLFIDRGDSFRNKSMYDFDNVYVLPSLTGNKDNWNLPNFTLSWEGFKNEFEIATNIVKLANDNFPKKVNNTMHGKVSSVALQRVEEIASKNQVVEYINKISSIIGNASDKESVNGAIVMNCNPFTLGHRYLVEYASKNVDNLIIFVVEENLSFFRFKDRFDMVIKGVKDISNVHVVPSGNFIISSLTFPDYFTKENRSELEFDVSTDIYFFGKFIAPQLNISKRFVGTEPTCITTKKYNEEMKRILPSYGVSVIEIERKAFTGYPISASLVRKFLNQKELSQLSEIVPQTTLEVLLDKYYSK